MCLWGGVGGLSYGESVVVALLIGRVRKNSGGKRQAKYKPQVTTGKRRSHSPLVPLSLTTQVTDQ